MGADNVLNKIDSALKAITTGDFDQGAPNGGLLYPEQAERFIRVVENSTPLFQAARRLTMNSYIRDIDLIQFGGRILQQQQEGVAIANEQTVTPTLNQLISQELGGFVGLTDTALEDNIERGQFENTLIDLLGGQVGRDLEHLAMSGDTTLTADNLLKTTDGWLKKANNQIAGVGTAPTAGQFLNNNPVDMLEKLLLAVPYKYIQDRAQWTYYVPFSTENDIRNFAINRKTDFGDNILVSNQGMFFKGIKIEVVPQMPVDQAMLAPAANLVYGLYRDVRIERDRIPKARKTDFVVSLRFDCNFEDQNAVAVASDYVGGVVIDTTA